MVNEQVGIRRALATDASMLEQVQVQSQQAMGTGPFRSVDWPMMLALPDCFTYLAETSTAFGVISVGLPTEEFFDDGNTGEVLAWCLLPAFWRQGYGRKLLVHGLSVIKRRHKERALAWVPGSGRAIFVLEALGFEDAGATRLVNQEDGELREQAYVLDLSDYF